MRNTNKPSPARSGKCCEVAQTWMRTRAARLSVAPHRMRCAAALSCGPTAFIPVLVPASQLVLRHHSHPERLRQQRRYCTTTAAAAPLAFAVETTLRRTLPAMRCRLPRGQTAFRPASPWLSCARARSPVCASAGGQSASTHREQRWRSRSGRACSSRGCLWTPRFRRGSPPHTCRVAASACSPKPSRQKA